MARMKLLDEKIYEDVNEESIELLNDYILEMRSLRKSEGTIYQYVADIKGFYCWVHTNAKNKSVLELKKRDFRKFFLYMDENGASNARINRMQCSLRNMLTYAVSDDDIYDDYEINVMANIKGLQKESVREITFVTDAQIKTIIDYLLEKERYREALYLSLSYDSAGRKNEIFQVNKEGFTTAKQTNEVIGKRAKRFPLLYFSRTREIAKLYLEQRGEDNEEALFVTGVGESAKRASYDTLYAWSISFGKILKESCDVSLVTNPHCWRHSCLENMSEGNHYALNELGKDKLDIDILRVLANHESIDTTKSYLKNDDSKLLNEAFGL